MATPPRPAFVVGNLLGSRVYDFVAEYLSSPNRNATSTAASLTSLIIPLMSSVSDLQGVCYLWGVIFFMATTFHASSPKHSFLVELVLEIRKCSAPASESRSAFEKQWGTKFWVGLPMWEAVWNDYVLDAPLLPRMAERKYGRTLLENRLQPGLFRSRDGSPMTSRAWASLNAFGARLFAQTDLMNIDAKAMFALVEALEEDKAASALDNTVPAAAVWILYAGKKIKESNVGDAIGYEYLTNFTRSPWRRANINKETSGLSDERWSFWNARFNDLGKQMDLKRNTRLYARQARCEMEGIEPAAVLSGSMIIDAGKKEHESQQVETTMSEGSGGPSRRLLVSDLIN